MDKKLEILLNSEKNVNSVNTDVYDKIELETTTQTITEYDVRNVLSATEVFDIERQENAKYRIYGKMEYMSLLNGLISQYTKFSDFFTPNHTGDSKNITNSFDFYLVRSYSGFTEITENVDVYINDLSEKIDELLYS